MANEVTGLLTKKIGPFPGYVWAVVVGGVAFFVLPKLTGGTTAGKTSAATDTTGAAMTSGYQQGFAQGAQYYPGPQSSPAGQSSQQRSDLVAGWYQKYLHRAGSPGEIQNWVNQFDAHGAGWVEGAIANSPEGQHPGSTSTAGRADGAPPGIPQSGGAGRSNSISSRSADQHAYFHPAMMARVRYAHFVRGFGGAGYAEQVHQTAHSAAIHPARLQALNATPSGLIRIA
jgi:hypothetical protein